MTDRQRTDEDETDWDGDGRTKGQRTDDDDGNDHGTTDGNRTTTTGLMRRDGRTMFSPEVSDTHRHSPLAINTIG